MCELVNPWTNYFLVIYYILLHSTAFYYILIHCKQPSSACALSVSSYCLLTSSIAYLAWPRQHCEPDCSTRGYWQRCEQRGSPYRQATNTSGCCRLGAVADEPADGPATFHVSQAIFPYAAAVECGRYTHTAQPESVDDSGPRTTGRARRYVGHSNTSQHSCQQWALPLVRLSIRCLTATLLTVCVRLPTAVPQRQLMPAAAAAAAAQQANSDRTREKVTKCKNFLETLIRLSSQQPQQIVENVKKLIQGLLVSVCFTCSMYLRRRRPEVQRHVVCLLQEGSVQPDAFTNRLQLELNSQKQPGLSAFLKVRQSRSYLLSAPGYTLVPDIHETARFYLRCKWDLCNSSLVSARYSMNLWHVTCQAKWQLKLW